MVTREPTEFAKIFQTIAINSLHTDKKLQKKYLNYEGNNKFRPWMWKRPCAGHLKITLSNSGTKAPVQPWLLACPKAFRAGENFTLQINFLPLTYPLSHFPYYDLINLGSSFQHIRTYWMFLIISIVSWGGLFTY